MLSSRARSLLLAFLVLSLVLMRSTGASPTPKWRVDLVYLETSDTSFGVALEAFKQAVQQRTRGRLAIVLHPDGRWQGVSMEDLDLVKAVREGRPQMALVTTAPLSHLSPQLEVLNVPFLFTGYGHVDRVLQGPIGLRLLGAAVAQGLRGLTFMDGGFRVFAANRPLSRLDDFRGLRVRTLQNRSYVNLVKAFHGVPVPAGINKIHAMAQRGFIDAADRSWPTYWSLKLQDVLKFVTETNHGYAAKILIVNEVFHASLPPDVQRIVKQAAAEACARQRGLFRAELASVRKQAPARGVRVVTLTRAEREAFEVASRPVQEQVAAIAGRDLVEGVRALAR